MEFRSRGAFGPAKQLHNLQGPTENRQGEWAPWLNIIIIIIIIIILIKNLCFT